ncbi:MAG: restriction endonuclease [Phototrophicales bacterium]|nr:MAG: restriction endonuclease [Phototrophicales bacterium]
MNWIEDLEQFCEKYNIPLDFLAETLNEPKVVPMIRGKAFEFSVMLALQHVLPQDEFTIEKNPMNAQRGIHDEDVLVIHKPSGSLIRVECKLAAKGRFAHQKDGSNEIRVKCMRSRTLGAEMVKNLAPQWGVSEDLLSIHNDQYLPHDFDVVVTSIGNAFYVTNENTQQFEWGPSEDGIIFLHNLGGNLDNLKDFAFNKMYVARSADLSVTEHNGVKCTRKKCSQPHDCGFIPNYPKIIFEPGQTQPAQHWIELDDSVDLFRSIALKRNDL